jgi:hypothetical protein
VSTIRRLAPWLSGFVGVLIAGSADAQNIDAGKSPAQIFADTCSACHRNARELKRTSAGFLRSHYTTGQEEAAAMASYLAGVGSDPRAVQQRRPPGSLPGAAPAEAAKQTPRQLPTEQAKGLPGQPSGKGARRPPASGETRPLTAAVPEEKPPEPASAAAPASGPAIAVAPPKPVLVPFEE